MTGPEPLAPMESAARLYMGSAAYDDAREAAQEVRAQTRAATDSLAAQSERALAAAGREDAVAGLVHLVGVLLTVAGAAAVAVATLWAALWVLGGWA